MSSRKSPRTNTTPESHSGDAKPTTVVPPGGIRAVRAEMPTLIDEVELEAARVLSMRDSSIPPLRRGEAPEARRSDEDIEIVWAPESEQLNAEELFSKYVRLLGPFTRVPFVTVPFDQLPSLSLDNRMGFLVALIDGTSTIQTLLDVAGMPAREALHALATLRDLGIVAFRDE
jgi:hypothetical protein